MNILKTTKNILTLKNVSYGYVPHKPVVDGVNLQVPTGRFIGLLGPSGSGKSTLLKMIVGLYKPWNGSIEFIKESEKEQRNVHSPPIIGYVPQVESVDWTFPVTVKEVIAMGVWNQSGLAPWIVKNTSEEIDYILDSLGIDAKIYGKRQIRELSGGEQQRVFLARALIRNPQILVLDEPTSGVDYNTRERILEILTELNAKGITILLSTHDIPSVARRLPWVVCLNRNIISEGSPLDTLTETNLLKTYGISLNDAKTTVPTAGNTESTAIIKKTSSETETA